MHFLLMARRCKRKILAGKIYSKSKPKNVLRIVRNYYWNNCLVIKLTEKKSTGSEVWRPDVYICNECQHRFDKAKYITITEDDIVFQRAVCPKCNSENIRLSSWSEKDFKK